ncbi:SUKH-4 family immunity protein [Streptomyces rubiginosohelvolus]
MKFVITADDVRSVFGLTGVVPFPRYDAPHNRLDDRVALLLSTVGLPDAAWFMSKPTARRKSATARSTGTWSLWCTR